MFLVRSLNLASGFVEQQQIKWATTSLVSSVTFNYAAENVPKATTMVGLTAIL